MELYRKNGKFIIVLVIIVQFCWETEGATVTCETQYGFLPCTSGPWGTLFLILVYQYLMSIGQSYISNGSDRFFSLFGPGFFGASLFHILANFPMLFIVLESRLFSDHTGVSGSAVVGMGVLAGSAVMSMTLIWPSIIVFGSYDLANDDHTILPQLPEEPSFLTKLTAHGLTTDTETSYTARLLLVSMIPFLILQIPIITNSTSVIRVVELVAVIVSLSFFIASIVYQIFQPWIQNRCHDYVRQQFVKYKLLKLLSTNGKANARLIRDLYKELDKNHDGKVTDAELKTLLLGIQVQADGALSQELVDRIMDQLELSRDKSIQEDEFVRVLTQWLHYSKKSLSKHDYNPLSFFTRPQVNTNEEQQEALMPKEKNGVAERLIYEYLKALALVLIGIAMTVLIAGQLIMNVANFAIYAKVPSFFIPYFVIPGAINIPRLLSTIRSASQKTQRAASLTLSQIYSGVFMSNMSSLSTFLLTVYIKGEPWNVSAEVLVVLVICVAMGIFTSTRTIFPRWTGFVGYLLYPIAILMLYLLKVVWVWS